MLRLKRRSRKTKTKIMMVLAVVLAKRSESAQTAIYSIQK